MRQASVRGPGGVWCLFEGRNGRSLPGLRWAFLLVAGLLGCPAAPDRPGIVPDSATGRRAIGAAMLAWKAGRPAGGLEPTSPRVQVVDTHRKPGQALEGFEIVSESADGRSRAFGVRLALAGPEERPIVRFLAVGIDPVLVFRQEDYDLLMHWEHRMDPEPGKDGTPPAPPPPTPRPEAAHADG